MCNKILSIVISASLFVGCSNDKPSADEDSSGTPERCAEISSSIENAGFDTNINVTCEDSRALITSNTFPDHEMMTGIIGSNEQIPVPAVNYVSPIPLAPVRAASILTRDAALGVAVNGVPIYDYSAGGELSQDDLRSYQPRLDTIATGQLDNCGGHSGRGDDYHYHARPTCMIEQMANAGDDAIIGWAFDGYPIYGNNNPDGSTIADGTLGICNEQSDTKFGVRYHTSDSWPYIVQCLVGEVGSQPDALPRVPPLHDADGNERPPGTPPQGGVDNLTLTVEGDARVMRYQYRSEDYYIRYEPADTPNCYLFETRTVTDNGTVRTGEYCR